MEMLFAVIGVAAVFLLASYGLFILLDSAIKGEWK